MKTVDAYYEAAADTWGLGELGGGCPLPITSNLEKCDTFISSGSKKVMIDNIKDSILSQDCLVLSFGIVA